MPEFSVIIPSYNHEKYIKQAISSVLTQSMNDLELIIVDDGSHDNSLEIISNFTDPRLQVHSQANRGAHDAINRGIRAAKGKYIAILNSDDTYEPNRLEKIRESLRANPEIGLIGTHINLMDSTGNLLGIKEGYKSSSPWLLDFPEKSFRGGESLQKALLTENYLATTSNFAFLKEWFYRVGEFRPLRYAHDWDFALRIARQAPIYLIPEPLVNYRIHASNTIRENHAAMIFEIGWCLAVHLPRYSSNPALLNTSSPLDVDQLIHSIYLFGAEKMLGVMLLQRLAEDEPLALSLLDVDNPIRQSYLNFISQELSQATSPAAPQNKLFTWWNKPRKLYS